MLQDILHSARAVALAGIIALASLFACSSESPGPAPQPSPTVATPSPTAVPPAAAAAPSEMPSPAAEAPTPDLAELTKGLCIPAAPLGVAVGDTWTIAGPVNISGSFPAEVPEGAAQTSLKFTVNGIESEDFGAPNTPNVVENSVVRVHIESTVSDKDGRPIASDQGETAGPTINIGSLPPVVTPDWECHRQSWLDGWAEVPADASSPAPEAMVEERTLASGTLAVLFSVKQSVDLQEQGFQQTSERRFGYDKATGRLVLVENHTTGMLNGQPFGLDTTQEVVPQ